MTDLTSVVEKAYAPRLKLFLSADIVGSTALKQNFKAELADVVWPEVIQGFYRNFIEQVENRWANASIEFEDKHGDSQANEFFGPTPKFWKTVGDEVLFWKELTNERQVWATLAIWLSSISSIRQFFRRFEEREVRALDIKSAAWVAGFPVRNRMFRSSGLNVDDFANFLGAIYDSEVVDTSLSYDFVGPSIDIGFRLAACSTQRKMFVDSGTAYLLARSSSHIHDARAEELGELIADTIGSSERDVRQRLAIHYDGSDILKGVADETKYPRFWINAAEKGTSEALREEMMFPNGRQPTDSGKIISFCDQYYEEQVRSLSRPFIDRSGTLTYQDKPANYDGERSQMMQEIVAGIEDGNSMAF